MWWKKTLSVFLELRVERRWDLGAIRTELGQQALNTHIRWRAAEAVDVLECCHDAHFGQRVQEVAACQGTELDKHAGRVLVSGRE